MSNVIDNAKNYMLTYGMTKGRLHNPADNSVCMMGAMTYGNDTEDQRTQPRTYNNAHMALVEVIRSEYSDRLRYLDHPSVPEFNDHVDTTLDDVVRVFEKASAKLDEQV